MWYAIPWDWIRSTDAFQNFINGTANSGNLPLC